MFFPRKRICKRNKGFDIERYREDEEAEAELNARPVAPAAIPYSRRSRKLPYSRFIALFNHNQDPEEDCLQLAQGEGEGER